MTIYHNPACGTSRNTLGLIRNAGIEPTVIEYLKTPPDRATLVNLLARMGIGPRELLRERGTPYAELGLAAGHWTDAQLIDAMVAHPLLINRPIVVTPSGARLCRPAAAVLEILGASGTAPWQEWGSWSGRVPAPSVSSSSSAPRYSESISRRGVGYLDCRILRPFLG